MAKENMVQKIADLFVEAGRAHHQAFIETNGDDPDWPGWYADYLHEKLGPLLDANFTRSELTYLLVLLDKESNLRAPGVRWPIYYGKFFVDRYL